MESRNVPLPRPALSLPHEILVRIFDTPGDASHHRQRNKSGTSTPPLSTSLLSYADRLSCALVCQDWYYAAVDTLWRNIDIHYMQSWIQFSQALEKDFSLLSTEHQHRLLQLDNQQKLPRYATSDNTPETEAQAGHCNEADERSQCRDTVSLSSFTANEMSVDTSIVGSSQLPLSSLRGPVGPGPIGFAGRHFIRTFAIAETTDCWAPLPFPYLPSCITDSLLNIVSPFLTHLTSISLRHCSTLTDLAVIHIIVSSSPYLKQIDLTDCRRITNLTLQIIGRLCNQLNDICLQGCSLVTDDGLVDLALHCRQLQMININFCPRVSDRALMAFLNNSGNLMQMDLEGYRDNASTRLSKLCIAGCRGVSITGLLAIGQYFGVDREPALRSLEFTCPPLLILPPSPTMFIPMDPTVVQPRKVVSQATQIIDALPPTLEEISIHGAYALAKEDIISLVNRVGPRLKSLRLDNACFVDSEVLACILTTCQELTVLCIPGASQLKDEDIAHLVQAKCASRLIELNLSTCRRLTDASLTQLAMAKHPSASSSLNKTIAMDTPNATRDSKAIAKKHGRIGLFQSLRRLDLSYNTKMTLKGIIPLAFSIQDLCSLDISFCGDGVTTAWSQTAESIRPMLDEIRGNGLDSSQALLSGSSDNEGERAHPGLFEPSNEVIQEEAHDRHHPSAPPSNPTTTQQLQSPPLNESSTVSIPSRPGLGRYVGPLLHQTTALTQNNEIVPQHPQQFPGQGQDYESTTLGLVRHFAERRTSTDSVSSVSSNCTVDSRASTSSSSSASSSSSPSLVKKMSQLDLLKNRRGCHHPRHHRCTIECGYQDRAKLSGTPLADRWDVIEVYQGSVGASTVKVGDTWYTPQHRSQLHLLYQLQRRLDQDRPPSIAADIEQNPTLPRLQLVPREWMHNIVLRMILHHHTHNRTMLHSRHLRSSVSIGQARLMATPGNCEIFAWGLAKLREEWMPELV